MHRAKVELVFDGGHTLVVVIENRPLAYLFNIAHGLIDSHGPVQAATILEISGV